MCNHFESTDTPEERLRLQAYFDGDTPIAALNEDGDVVVPDDISTHKWPKSQAPILLQTAAGRALETARWGIATNIRGASGKMLTKFVTNARDDKLAGFTWRWSVAERRCLIPARAYYEPDGPAGAKWEVRFTVRGRRTFFLAGLWDFDGDGTTRSFTMVTTGPNELAAKIHDRMPLVLDPSTAAEWIGHTPLSADRLAAICRPYPAEQMLSVALPPPTRPIKKSDLPPGGGELTLF